MLALILIIISSTEAVDLFTYETSHKFSYYCESCFYGPVKLNFTFNYFGNNYDSIYIHNDGFISFEKCYGVSSCKNSISVYNSDEFIKGLVYFSEVKSRYKLETYAHLVRKKHEEFFCPVWGFQLTWFNIVNDKKNSFQLILVGNDHKSYVLRIYDKMEWPICENQFSFIGDKHNGKPIDYKFSMDQLMNGTNATKNGLWIKRYDELNKTSFLKVNFFLLFLNLISIKL
jgi:hypothetical protein